MKSLQETGAFLSFYFYQFEDQLLLSGIVDY